MKIITTLVVLFITATAGLKAATQDTLLDVQLLPNTEYNVSATVSTSLLGSLVTLLTGGPSPLQIVDDLGNVLAELPVDDLLGSLTGSAGAPVVVQLSLETGDTVGSATDLILRILDNPLLQVTNVSAAAQPKNRAPSVSHITRKKLGKNHNKILIRGLAKDSDGSIRKVEVIYKNTLKSVSGKSRFRSSFHLDPGSKLVRIRAIDDDGQVSATKRFRVSSK